MGCTINYSDCKFITSEKLIIYLCCVSVAASCRCESAGASGCHSSRSGLRNVCDCAQKGQLEVSFWSIPSNLDLTSFLMPSFHSIFCSSLHFSLFVLLFCCFFSPTCQLVSVLLALALVCVFAEEASTA